MTRHHMKVRIQNNWSLILQYKSKVGVLLNGWFGFHFLKQEDAKKIMSSPWVHGHGFLSLQKWSVGFDPINEVPI